MEKYYISPFDFFYPDKEELGKKFAKSAFNGCYGMESDDYGLTTILAMVTKGYEENEQEFIGAHIDIEELIDGVVKYVFPSPF